MDWLLLSINPAEPHSIDTYVAWHGRFMTMAWGILIPIGILVARFCKITRKQNWPEELDNQTWWYWHLAIQWTAGLLALIALGLMLIHPEGHADNAVHAYLGWTLMIAALLQFITGVMRGSKGGPTDHSIKPDCKGDHYDMTLRRKAFEYFHKSNGYVLLVASVVTILSGLWQANAPVWMWLVLSLWWLAFLVVFAYLQLKGYAVDTYQAIWGMDKKHPGNCIKPIGWGVRRFGSGDR